MWQEGHTVHATAEEAEARTQQMLNVYADFCAEDLAIPTIKGRKTDKEKFAGAVATYTIEALMHDGRALQSGTSHDFGDDFAKAYGIQFTDKDNKQKYAFQTSWGLSTRIIGALIMVHGDNSGLVLPPRIAPTQVVIVPIQQRKAGVLDKAYELKETLSNFRVKVDDSDKSPGFKFADQEMRGFPLRVEIGPRDIQNGKCIIARRDTGAKEECELDNLAARVGELLEQIQKDMYERAKKHLEEHTYEASSREEFEKIFAEKTGFVKAMWCGELACEEEIKEKFGVTSRCMPFEQEQISSTCVCCGKPAKKMVYWGKSY
jgi:prolyl-tRNA synthetase